MVLRDFTVLGDHLLMSVEESSEDGEETGFCSLWRSDGTSSGTGRFALLPVLTTIPNIAPPTERLVCPRFLFPFQDRMLFALDDNIQRGPSIWSTDWGEEGAVQIVGSADQAALADGFVFLGGEGLWTSDGTSDGTERISDVQVIRSATRTLNGVLLFAGQLGESQGLWTSDGTAGKTAPVQSILLDPGSSSPKVLTPIGEQVFFTAAGRAHVTDGAAEGTFALPIELEAPSAGISYIASNGFVFFNARHRRLLAFAPATEVLTEVHPDARERVPLGGRGVVFSGFNTEVGQELFFSDGTQAGTRLILDILPGRDSSFPNRLRSFGDEVVFWAGSNGSFQLWKTDGTGSATSPIIDATFTSPHTLTVVNDLVFFIGSDEIWRSDGTVAGTFALGGLTPPGFRILRSLAAFEDLFLILGESESGEQSFWTSDGTVEGTILQSLLPSGLRARLIFPGTNLIYMVLGDPERNFSLWVSDEGTIVRRVLSLRPSRGGLDDLTPTVMEVIGDILFFANSEPETGLELWRSDGTRKGTFQVSDLRPGLASSSPSDFALLGDDLLFAASTDEFGRELWKIPARGLVGGPMLIAARAIDSPLEAGATIQITGSGFLSDGLQIRINGIAVLDFSVLSDGLIELRLPAGLLPGPLEITVSGEEGTATLAGDETALFASGVAIPTLSWPGIVALALMLAGIGVWLRR